MKVQTSVLLFLKIEIGSSIFKLFLGFNEELKVLEDKIQNIATTNASDGTTEVSTFKIGEVCGVFVPFCNKWIRASVKGKDSEAGEMRYSVWAIDYGFPLVSRAVHTIKVPNSFQGMHLKNKTILIGGIENIVPAKVNYNVTMRNAVKEKLTKWTPEAIDLAQGILQRAIKLKFEQVHELKERKSHWFGRLMIQTPEKQMMNVVKCLIEMNFAALTDGDFAEEIKLTETLQQQSWLSAKGEMLDAKLIISPLVIPRIEGENRLTY